jgi:excisionase family DNA binding protein
MNSLDKPVAQIAPAGEGFAVADSKRITVGEIARELAVSIPTIYAMLRDRKIPNIRQGKLYIVSREAFARWLTTCGTGVDLLP